MNNSSKQNNCSEQNKIFNQNRQLNKNLIIAIALFIIPLTGLSIDIYVPSLPVIAKYFGITNLLVQNTISIYLLGLGVSQLIAGIIVDHFGRRNPLIITLIGYLLLTLIIINSSSIYIITYTRLLQGICMGITAVSARSVFTDLFIGHEYYKKASYITIAYSIGPIIAPAIGGYLQHYFSWQACFHFLVIYSLIAIILVGIFLPETITAKNLLTIPVVIQRYASMLTHPHFILGLICLSMLYTALMLFSLIGPFIIQNRLHYSAVTFGQLALLCGMAWFLGNITNRFLITININKKINYAFITIVADLILMLILAQYWFNLYVIVIPLLIFLISCSIIFSNYFLYTPTLFPQYAATASAFMAGSFSLISSSMSSLMDKVLSTDTQIPLIYGYFSLIGICIVAIITLGKINQFKKIIINLK